MSSNIVFKCTLVVPLCNSNFLWVEGTLVFLLGFSIPNLKIRVKSLGSLNQRNPIYIVRVSFSMHNVGFAPPYPTTTKNARQFQIALCFQMNSCTLKRRLCFYSCLLRGLRKKYVLNRYICCYLSW